MAARLRTLLSRPPEFLLLLLYIATVPLMLFTHLRLAGQALLLCDFIFVLVVLASFPALFRRALRPGIFEAFLVFYLAATLVSTLVSGAGYLGVVKVTYFVCVAWPHALDCREEPGGCSDSLAGRHRCGRDRVFPGSRDLLSGLEQSSGEFAAVLLWNPAARTLSPGKLSVLQCQHAVELSDRGNCPGLVPGLPAIPDRDRSSFPVQLLSRLGGGWHWFWGCVRADSGERSRRAWSWPCSAWA